MITEKEQQIVDAVNHYRGKYNPYHEWHDAIVFCDRLLWGFSIAGKCSNEVCTIDEFNQCVKEMSHGKSEPDYLIYLQEKTPLEPVMESKVSEGKLVYTQAMKDAGELPSVGMRVHMANDDCYGVWDDAEKFIGEDVNVLAVFKNQLGVDMVSIGSDDGCCCCFRADMCKPIDTRTPEQKQVDMVVNDIMIASSLKYEEAKRTALWPQERKLLAEIKQ